jgi:hypothetical protein
MGLVSDVATFWFVRVPSWWREWRIRRREWFVSTGWIQEQKRKASPRDY